MPLHYDTRKCDLNDISKDTISAMIHVTMVIDVGEFTEKKCKRYFLSY